MPLVLLQKLEVLIHLVDVEIALWAHELASLALVLHMPRQAVRKTGYIYLAEWALLVLRALVARAEMPFTLLIGERFPALVRTAELAHVENVANLARNLHLLKLLLAHRTGRVSYQPSVEASSADKRLALTTRSVFFQHVCANRAQELLQHLFEFGQSIVCRQFLHFVGRGAGA